MSKTVITRKVFVCPVCNKDIMGVFAVELFVSDQYNLTTLAARADLVGLKVDHDCMPATSSGSLDWVG